MPETAKNKLEKFVKSLRNQPASEAQFRELIRLRQEWIAEIRAQAEQYDGVLAPIAKWYRKFADQLEAE
jgi:hypothetical protein